MDVGGNVTMFHDKNPEQIKGFSKSLCTRPARSDKSVAYFVGQNSSAVCDASQTSVVRNVPRKSTIEYKSYSQVLTLQNRSNIRYYTCFSLPQG